MKYWYISLYVEGGSAKNILLFLISQLLSIFNILVAIPHTSDCITVDMLKNFKDLLIWSQYGRSQDIKKDIFADPTFS